MSFLFSNSKFNHPLNNWNVSSVTKMDNMFSVTEDFNQPLSNWDVSNVTSMFGIFINAHGFNQDLSTWNFNENVNFLEIIYNSGIDRANYDALLGQLVNLGYTDKSMIAKNLFYCNEEDRNFLINNLNWNISEDTLAENCSLYSNISKLSSLHIFPNPATSTIYLTNTTTLEKVELFNLQGKKIKTLKGALQQMDISELETGIYFIKLFAKENSKTLKVVKR
ncbi:surface protein [Mesonia maritima]|uniref:Surface protein n=2 Tax=Mesonia maritima TaxID=1793873 RepID=A0ABU1K5E0_9FLAO|nr:surface protein [Mesonia maritima]